MDVVQQLAKVQDFAKTLRDARFGAIRHPGEFFDYQRVSRPKDMQEYMKRASYNMCVGVGVGVERRLGLASCGEQKHDAFGMRR
jgi:hypothetical protein